MPFVEADRMERRIQMLADYDTGAFSVAALCRRYSVSRDTFYAWKARRAEGTADWFADRSHATRSCPHRLAGPQAEAIVALRRRFPHFGPKKLRAWLRRHDPCGAPCGNWPAASTIGDLLSREGLVAARPKRAAALDGGRTCSPAATANAEWCCDFKGWFRTADGRRCDPLTITDSWSRYLIEVRICAPTTDGIRPVFEAAFRTYGLPDAIRCDNGVPFGSPGVGGLSRLAVWWLRLGIAPRYIAPASPQQNGRHERMHRTLKAETSAPPAGDLAAQQARFDAFRRHYNEERPHEALGQLPPRSRWEPSPRPFPEHPDEPWYDADHQVRRVRPDGDIKWRGARLFIGEALAGETIGLAEQDNGTWLVRFCDWPLAIIDHRGLLRRFAPLRHRLREAAQQTPSHPTKVSTISPVQTVDHQPG